MVREVEEEARFAASWTGRAALDPRVLDALARVPRHEFMSEDDAAWAYANAARPIGCGQTISQPYVVALMTDLARIGPQDAVLEIGTGSGYQAAVLSLLARRVDSVERVPLLAREAAARLDRLGYRNVEVHEGDGWSGWPPREPYDAILLTAASPEVPPPLPAQLAPGGRLVLPVGSPGAEQDLVLIEKDAQGRVRESRVLPVAFVPLVRS
jgi:protein-L-isoaspartate(D-aspartate) O-methyltransferase